MRTNGRRWKKIIAKNVASACIAAAFLSILWMLVYTLVGNDLYVPSFRSSWAEFKVVLRERSFWTAFFSTLSRVVAAFCVSFIAAALTGVTAYVVPWFGRIVSPVVSALRSVPAAAVLLLILIWTNAGSAPVIVAFLSLFPMLESAVLAALGQTDKELAEMSRVYKVPLTKRIFQLYLPSSAPYILRESGAALAFSLKLVISAEILAATYSSLGGMMQEARLYLEMPRLFALVVATFLTGLLLELAGGALASCVERKTK